MTLKFFLYFVAAISLAVCVYAFVEGVTVITVEDQQKIAAEQGSAEAERPPEMVVEGKSTEPCESESIWTTYNIWGDTDSIYRASENGPEAETKVEESVSCEEPLESGAGH